MGFDDLGGDGEAEAGAFAGLFGGVEGVEDLAARFQGDAGAGKGGREGSPRRATSARLPHKRGF